VPRISTFYGIVIAMYFDEHEPPHFHARYAEYDAQVAIDGAVVLHGRLPPRALRLVQQWTELHSNELIANWNRARSGEGLVTIDPLP
jgi:hypothetical protein